MNRAIGNQGSKRKYFASCRKKQKQKKRSITQWQKNEKQNQALEKHFSLRLHLSPLQAINLPPAQQTAMGPVKYKNIEKILYLAQTINILMKTMAYTTNRQSYINCTLPANTSTSEIDAECTSNPSAESEVNSQTSTIQYFDMDSEKEETGIKKTEIELEKKLQRYRYKSTFNTEVDSQEIDQQSELSSEEKTDEQSITAQKSDRNRTEEKYGIAYVKGNEKAQQNERIRRVKKAGCNGIQPKLNRKKDRWSQENRKGLRNVKGDQTSEKWTREKQTRNRKVSGKVQRNGNTGEDWKWVTHELELNFRQPYCTGWQWILWGYQASRRI